MPFCRCHVVCGRRSLFFTSAPGAVSGGPSVLRLWRRDPGEVRDAAGLPVPGASMTLRNTLTGHSQQRSTDDAGRYSFTGLRPGRYWVPRLPARIGRPGKLRGGARIWRPRRHQLPPPRGRPQPAGHGGIPARAWKNCAKTRPRKWKSSRASRCETRATSVSDVLAEIPGVVTRRGSSSAVAGAQIQGIDSRQVLVLQDGLPSSAGAGSRAEW